MSDVNMNGVFFGKWNNGHESMTEYLLRFAMEAYGAMIGDMYEDDPDYFQNDYLSYETIWEQMRCLFTSWCFMENIMVTHAQCDMMLHEMYDNFHPSISRESFENYMVMYIV